MFNHKSKVYRGFKYKCNNCCHDHPVNPSVRKHWWLKVFIVTKKKLRDFLANFSVIQRKYALKNLDMKAQKITVENMEAMPMTTDKNWVFVTKSEFLKPIYLCNPIFSKLQRYRDYKIWVRGKDSIPLTLFLI